MKSLHQTFKFEEVQEQADFGTIFEAWLTSRVLYMSWDWKKTQKALKKITKTSQVTTKIAWKTMRDPAVVAAEAEAKAAEAARLQLKQEERDRIRREEIEMMMA